MTARAESHHAQALLVLGLGWLGLAAVLGATGMISVLPPAAGPLIVVGLTAAVLAAWALWPALRDFVAGLDARWLVALHLTRFVGAYFLYLYGRGELPYAFAVPGGWGDITVASLAVVLLALGPVRDGWHRGAYIGWNVLGLVDIVFVVATAGRLLASEPASMAPLLRLPLSLLPTFLVPLIIASHVILGAKLARTPTRSRSA